MMATLASTLPVDRAIWGSCFPAFAPALTTIGLPGRHDAYETTRLDSWSVGRIAIIGDAAHAMPPTLAQGACCAMMNALSLASSCQTNRTSWGLCDGGRLRSVSSRTTPKRDPRSLPARALGSGTQWDDIGLRAALHVPAGTQPKEYERVRRSEGLRNACAIKPCATGCVRRRQVVLGTPR
jgi:2-methyl-3-hydroxypyridine 5-carboxylic acid dioxygenase